MGKSANDLISQAKAWIGCKETDGSHKKIIDVYNSHKPLARGYKVKYTDAWCATFVSACAIKCGMTDIIPTECGCGPFVELLKKKGVWVESDSITPKPGYIILYDWDDNGKGDNKGNPDHIGIVEKVSGGKITIIEGNYHGEVKRRTISVNGRYIRGYGAPKYKSSGSSSSGTSKPSTSNKTPSKTVKYKGKVTANALNVRTWAGVENSKCSFSPLYKGAKVEVCDNVKAKDGSKWYYIKYGGKYGFVISTYIAKI